MAFVYIGLGTNMGNRNENLVQAINLLNRKGASVIRVSGIYDSEPWGFTSKNKFLNQVIKVETSLEPLILLELILQIENEMGRTRHISGYEDRIIDIDILIYDNRIIKSKKLEIPHKQMHSRAFVLAPLLEIAPDLVHPVLNKSIKDLHKELPL